MKNKSRRLATIAIICAAFTMAGTWVFAESNRVTFPANLEQLVHYATVKRGASTEHMLTSQTAIDPVK